MSQSFLVCLIQIIPRFLNLISFKSTEPKTMHLYTSVVFFFPLVLFLKNFSLIRATQLVDICAVDQVQFGRRFALSYIFTSTSLAYRFFIYLHIKEGESVPSISSLFPNALWLERELWDLFGIFFYGHSDLRRILTDYGFEGFPLRKDFPLSGYIELRYDDACMHIVYEPVELLQNYRAFNSLSPWESVKI